MWFKFNTRLFTEFSNLSNAELGLLLRLIEYAWQVQGLTSSDLAAFAHKRREPIENVFSAWEDFLLVAVEREGKHLLPEQWEGLDSYAQKVQAGKQRQEKARTANKGLTGHTAPAHVQRTSSGAEQNKELEKKSIRKRKSPCSLPKTSDDVLSPAKPFVDYFLQEFNRIFPEIPYTKGTAADNMQLRQLRLGALKDGRECLTLEHWKRCVDNYLRSTDGAIRTIADLASRARAFYGAPLNQFKQPLPSGINPAPQGISHVNQSKPSYQQQNFTNIANATETMLRFAGSGGGSAGPNPSLSPKPGMELLLPSGSRE